MPWYLSNKDRVTTALVVGAEREVRDKLTRLHSSLGRVTKKLLRHVFEERDDALGHGTLLARQMRRACQAAKALPVFVVDRQALVYFLNA